MMLIFWSWLNPLIPWKPIDGGLFAHDSNPPPWFAFEGEDIEAWLRAWEPQPFSSKWHEAMPSLCMCYIPWLDEPNIPESSGRSFALWSCVSSKLTNLKPTWGHILATPLIAKYTDTRVGAQINHGNDAVPLCVHESHLICRAQIQPALTSSWQI